MAAEEPKKNFDQPNLQEPEQATEYGQVSRRKAIQQMVAVAGGGSLLAGTAMGALSLFNPKVEAVGELNVGFTYSVSAESKKEGRDWYVPLDGKTAAVSDFKNVGDGAATLWRGIYDDEGNLSPGTGIPAILLRVDPNTIKTQFDQLFDGIVGPGIVGYMAKCLHACCVPNWKLARRDLEVFYCICHDSLYDPFSIVPYEHPNGIKYWGAERTGGPAPRGLPIIPLELDGDTIIGRIDDIGWYEFCGVEPPIDESLDSGGH